jgi:outer membrane protein assembly factor BamB
MQALPPLRPALALLATLAATLFACGPGPGDGARGEWPQFRGPGGQGRSAAKNIPVSWPADGSGVRWKTAIPGVGNSSPIVSNGKIFLTSAVEVPRPADAPPCPEPCADPGQLERSLVALDAATGKLLWRSVVFSAPPFKHHMLNTNTAPTPVADGRYVYAYFGSHLACFDFDGKQIWQKEVDPGYVEHLRYGVGSSPVLVGEAVVVIRDKEYGVVERDTGWLGAFDRKTGEELWRVNWQETCCSYSTPLVHEREGKPEIIVAHSGRLTAYDPENGERLWSFEHPMLQVVSSLLAEKDLVCYLGGADHDRGSLCIRVKGRGAEAKTEELWFLPHGPEASSPVMIGENIFTLADNGVVRMIDRQTGEIRKIDRLEGLYFRGSLAAADRNVYAFSTSGHVAVVRPTDDGKSFEIVAQNQLGDDGNNASPAIGAGCLLLRSYTHLYCVGNPPAAG